MEKVNDWPYTLEKDYSMWHWNLRKNSTSLLSWHGASWTKYGAYWTMKRIQKREARRKETREDGYLG